MSKSGRKSPLPILGKLVTHWSAGWGKRALGSCGDGGRLVSCMGTVIEWGLDEEGDSRIQNYLVVKLAHII